MLHPDLPIRLPKFRYERGRRAALSEPPLTGQSPGVDVDACGRLEDHPGLLGVDAVGAGMVDEEAEAVGREPDVAALATLA